MLEYFLYIILYVLFVLITLFIVYLFCALLRIIFGPTRNIIEEQIRRENKIKY